MRMIGVPDIATAVPRLPPENVERYWPLLVVAMQKEGIASPPALIAMAATVAVETAWRFKPLTEFYPRDRDPVSYFESMYGSGTSRGQRLGNKHAGDGYRYRGHGLIQLTGRANFARMGQRLGIPLEQDPDLALAPVESARIAAAYFRDRGVWAAADQLDWRAVRKLVNGGYNGWDEFIGVVDRLVLLARQRGADVYPVATDAPLPPAPELPPIPALPDPVPMDHAGIRVGPPIDFPRPTTPEPRLTLTKRLSNMIRAMRNPHRRA